VLLAHQVKADHLVHQLQHHQHLHAVRLHSLKHRGLHDLVVQQRRGLKFSVLA
jgi:hypothetical protein